LITTGNLVVVHQFQLSLTSVVPRYPIARPSTTAEILERSLALCPELAPPEIRAVRAPTIDDLRPLVIEEGCGFRPARKGGVRLDVDWTTNGTRAIPVIFNYGYVPFL
jgi:D-amino-acid oxidase